MDRKVYDTYVRLLHNELAMATGCTEPIAVAYAGAKLREVLGDIPERCTVYCSGNIIKNVMAVTVPNSGGSRGIENAAMLGIIGGDATRVLDVLHSISDENIALMHKTVAEGRCTCELVEGVENLYIRMEAQKGSETALVEIRNYHSNITRIEKNGEVVFDADAAAQSGTAVAPPDKSLLNVRDIITFADEVELDDVRDVLENQLKCNSAIAEEGLKNPWGAEVGRTILESSQTLVDRARAYAAAGSDARMNGCALPVVINSGSGNQGITVSMPVLVYAREYNIPHEKLLRALTVSNLLSLLQKRYIGSLSAYCGATSAGTGAACGICYMLGGTYEEICGIITNTTNTVGGMVCDGAKSSCASKIATAVGMALLAMDMSKKGRVFKPGEGLVEDNIEDTIASIGRMGREGMKSTDIEVLKIMLGQ